MTKRLGRSTSIPEINADHNVDSYDPRQDGRSDVGRVQHWRLDRVEPSPFQIRRIFPDTDIEQLADSILKNGLIHEPRARMHPTRPGWLELMPGEMRLRALQRLIERGEAPSLLQQDGEGNWLIPVIVEDVPADRAEDIVFAENLDRTDLTHWEWALAWRDRRNSLRERGLPAAVIDVADRWKRKKSTVGDYLRVADAFTLELAMAAGVVQNGDFDHRRLGILTMAAMQRVARVSDHVDLDKAALTLLQELKRANDPQAASELKQRTAAMATRHLTPQGFQVNIRTPLGELTSKQARNYLTRLAPTVRALAARVDDLPARERASLVADLEAALARIRPS